MPGWWTTNCLIYLGEFSLREKWALLIPRAVQFSYSVSVKAIIRNINSNGAMLSLCLTPTLNSMGVSTLPMMSLAMPFSFMHLIYEHSLGGAPYFPSIATSSACLEVSKALTKSANTNHVGILWLFIRCRSVLILNLSS